MVGVLGKYKGCEICCRRWVKVSWIWGCFLICLNMLVIWSGEKVFDFVDIDIVLCSVVMSDLFVRNVLIVGENVKVMSGKWCLLLECWILRVVLFCIWRRVVVIFFYFVEMKSNGEEVVVGLRFFYCLLFSL